MTFAALKSRLLRSRAAWCNSRLVSARKEKVQAFVLPGADGIDQKRPAVTLSVFPTFAAHPARSPVAHLTSLTRALFTPHPIGIGVLPPTPRLTTK